MKLIFYPLVILALSMPALSAVEADNSALNKRDQQAQEKTADKHGTSEQDIKISSQLRQSIVKNKTLSTYAQNIKIITVNGEVTLKGPVKSSQEQKALVSAARKVSGVTQVVDQTQVATK